MRGVKFVGLSGSIADYKSVGVVWVSLFPFLVNVFSSDDAIIEQIF
jgi:hypothetical protein